MAIPPPYTFAYLDFPLADLSSHDNTAMVQGLREGFNELLERVGEGWQCTSRRGLGSLWQLMGNMGQSKTLHLAILIFHGVEPWDTIPGAPWSSNPLYLYLSLT